MLSKHAFSDPSSLVSINFSELWRKGKIPTKSVRVVELRDLALMYDLEDFLVNIDMPLRVDRDVDLFLSTKSKKDIFHLAVTMVVRQHGISKRDRFFYDGDLVRAPLFSRPNDGDFLQIANVTRAFIAYHTVKEDQAKVLRGTVNVNGGNIDYPDPRLYSHKRIDWSRFMPYFDQLADSRTEGQLSMPEFKLFVPCQELEGELLDVPIPELVGH